MYFVGATQFGLKCLQALVNLDGVEVVGVLTAPREFRISYSEEPVSNAMWADFAPTARANNLPLHRMESSMLDGALWPLVFGQDPDCFFVAGWYHMVPQEWLAEIKAYGLHASLLPSYRGGAPLVWAMINGERTTGVTLFQMDEGVDTGPILFSREVEIGEEDEIGDLIHKVERASLSMILEDFPLVASGEIAPMPQPAGDWGVMPQRSPSDGKIDWLKRVAEVSRFIRAQTAPYPGAFFDVAESRIHVWACRVAKELDFSANPAAVVNLSGHFYIRCSDGWIELVRFDSDSSHRKATIVLEEVVRPLWPATWEA